MGTVVQRCPFTCRLHQPGTWSTWLTTQSQQWALLWREGELLHCVAELECSLPAPLHLLPALAAPTSTHILVCYLMLEACVVTLLSQHHSCAQGHIPYTPLSVQPGR